MVDIQRLSRVTGTGPFVDRPGRVGFFWIIPGRISDFVLKDAIPLTAAEAYGDTLTHPGGHYDFWGALQAKRSSGWRPEGFSVDVLDREYEEWPRGRVVFHYVHDRFTIYADRRLQIASRIALVAKAFELSEGTFKVRSDPHYR